MDTNIAKEYGSFIKDKRMARGLSQRETAKLIGISQQGYSRYERGDREPNFTLMMKISDVLIFSPGEFFDRYMSERYAWYSEKLKECKNGNQTDIEE